MIELLLVASLLGAECTKVTEIKIDQPIRQQFNATIYLPDNETMIIPVINGYVPQVNRKKGYLLLDYTDHRLYDKDNMIYDRIPKVKTKRPSEVKTKSVKLNY